MAEDDLLDDEEELDPALLEEGEEEDDLGFGDEDEEEKDPDDLDPKHLNSLGFGVEEDDMML